VRKLFLFLIAASFGAGPAFGWGCDGHQITALIARAHLTPEVSAEVNRILASDPLPAEKYRYCQDNPTDPMAVAAPWADDRRAADKTAQWHYIDIPRAVPSGDYHKWCQPIGPSIDGMDRPGCIVNAIEYELGVVRDKKKALPERAVALRYLIHFLGDLSQPLHDTDNHDQGGNCTSYRLPWEDRPSNLHSIWDSGLVTHELKTKKLTSMELASMLDEQFAGAGRQLLGEKPDVETWAWEGHKVASNFTYGLLVPELPIAPADAGQTDETACRADRDRMQAMHLTLNQNYIDLAMNTIREQLVRGGYRMAAVLNEALNEALR
jgi:hypothetical protein